MALFKNKDAGSSAGKFESPDDDTVIDGTVTEVVEETTQTTQPSAQERLKAAAAEREAEAAAERAAVESTKTALATKPATNAVLASPVARPVAVFEPLKNSFPVQWNTLELLKASQGKFVNKADNTPLGDEIGFELLSHQAQFVVSPGTDDDEDDKLVRYSDDGITTSTGEDCKEYLKYLQDAGYAKAKMSERVVLVGSVFDPGKQPSYKDKLMQISLAPTSKALFDRHQLQCSFNVARGKWSPDGITMLRMTCVSKSGNGKDWTEVAFSKYHAE